MDLVIVVCLNDLSNLTSVLCLVSEKVCGSSHSIRNSIIIRAYMHCMSSVSKCCRTYLQTEGKIKVQKDI